MRRSERIAILEEATRKLVEGRCDPTARDRGFPWPHAGQRVVWLTREQWERYRAALDEDKP